MYSGWSVPIGWKPNGLPDDEKRLYQDSNFYQYMYFSANAGITTRYCMHAYFTFIHWGRSSGYDHFSESNLVSSRYEQERDPLGRHTKWGRGSITRYNPTTFDLRYPWGVVHQRRTVQGRAVQRIKNCAASIQLERWSIFKNIVWSWGGKRVVLCNRDKSAAKRELDFGVTSTGKNYFVLRFGEKHPWYTQLGLHDLFPNVCSGPVTTIGSLHLL
jgi:hypothetical protein